jgi:hypothetical protein
VLAGSILAVWSFLPQALATIWNCAKRPVCANESPQRAASDPDTAMKIPWSRGPRTIGRPPVQAAFGMQQAPAAHSSQTMLREETRRVVVGAPERTKPLNSSIIIESRGGSAVDFAAGRIPGEAHGSKARQGGSRRPVDSYRGVEACQ